MNYFNNIKNEEELKATYRKLVKTTHPDAGGICKEFNEVAEQYRKITQGLEMGRLRYPINPESIPNRPNARDTIYGNRSRDTRPDPGPSNWSIPTEKQVILAVADQQVQMNLKVGYIWEAFQAKMKDIGLDITYEGLKHIAKVSGYKEGWAYYKAKDLNIKQ